MPAGFDDLTHPHPASHPQQGAPRLLLESATEECRYHLAVDITRKIDGDPAVARLDEAAGTIARSHAAARQTTQRRSLGKQTGVVMKRPADPGGPVPEIAQQRGDARHEIKRWNGRWTLCGTAQSHEAGSCPLLHRT